jgi:hypothetical protein
MSTACPTEPSTSDVSVEAYLGEDNPAQAIDVPVDEVDAKG